MDLKQLIILTFLLITLNGCAQNIALIGPAYTLASSGNVLQAGLSYGSNEAITRKTGKSTAQNIQEILKPKKDDSEFEKLVKKNINKTREKLNLPN
jgi:hypothetical protein